MSSSSPAPNIAVPFAQPQGGEKQESFRAFHHGRREMPRRRAAFRQDELSHGGSAGRGLGSGEGGGKSKWEDLAGTRVRDVRLLQTAEAVKFAGAPKSCARIGRRGRGRGRGGNPRPRWRSWTRRARQKWRGLPKSRGGGDGLRF